MKKTIYTFIALMFFFIEIMQAQTTFKKTFSGCGLGNDVQQTSDGGYIMVGSTDSRYFSLIKTNSSGIVVWNQTYGSQYYYGYSVQQTSDGGYIAVGHAENLSSYRNVYLVKTNSSGVSTWTQQFGASNDQDYGKSVRQTADGGYIIAGYTDKNGSDDVYLIKTNSSGVSVWTKTYGGSGTAERGYCVRQTTDGGYIIGGSKGIGGDVFLIKTNSNGDTSWTKTYNGYSLNIDGGNIVQQTTDGGYIIACDKLGGSIYTTLIKTNSTGDTLWTKTYPYGDDTKGVQQTTDGGYIVIAATNNFGALGGYPDIFIMKTNLNGDTLWTRHFGTINYEYGNSVRQTTDGGYIITGSVCSSPDYLTYLIKTNGNGYAGINENSLDNHNLAKIYPNPANNYLTIETSELTKENTLTICNINGQEVIKQRIKDSKTQIDISNLTSGIYFVKLNTNKAVEVKKIIKE